MEEKEKERFQTAILAALIQSTGEDIKERFWHVSCRLRDEMIEEQFLPLYQALVRYQKLTGQVIDVEDLGSALKGAGKSEADQFRFIEMYKRLAGMQVKMTTAKFKWAVVRLIDIVKSEKMAETLTDAMQILTDGKMVGGVMAKGYDAAVKVIAARSTDLDRITGYVPEGNMKDEIGEMRDEYKAIKVNKSATYIKTGIREIDDVTFGMTAGDLWLVGAYTSQGKTTLVENIIYDAAFVQGKNVVLGTAESTRAQVRRRLACLHCRKSPKFEGRVLRYKDIKGGTLSLPDEDLYNEVLDDLTNGNYGRIQIFQMPYRCTPRYILDRLIAYQGMFNIDLFVLDYLNLVHSDRKRVEKREEIDEVIIEMKQIAVSFNNKGIPVLSPWQAKQAQWVEAAKVGHYTLAVLANTSESERSADVILTLLQMADEPGKLRAQILKNRDGEKILEPFELEEDFGCCYIGSRKQADDILNTEDLG